MRNKLKRHLIPFEFWSDTMSIPTIENPFIYQLFITLLSTSYILIHFANLQFINKIKTKINKENA